ncbi:MAG: sugar transferase [Lachnospiraceae bacterium]|nr:sugar transferase [Lachnospiraceae bacterium]
MREKSRMITTVGLMLTDYVCFVAAYLIALNIRFEGKIPGGYYSMMYMTVGVSIALFYTLYQLAMRWRYSFMEKRVFGEVKDIVIYDIAMVAFVSMFLYMTRYGVEFARWVLIYLAVILPVLMLAGHMILKSILHKYYTQENVKIKVLLVSQSAQLEDAFKRLQSNLSIQHSLEGVICLDAEREDIGTDYQGVPMLANAENMLELVRQYAVDEVFLDVNDEGRVACEELVQNIEEMGVTSHYCIGINRQDGKQGKVENYGDCVVVSYAKTHANEGMLAVKRFIDICGGLVGIIITGIAFPFIALAIKLDSPGPILFCQTRIGKNGRRFNFYKFRSMYIDAEERKKELMAQNQVKGLMFKMDNDPRITKVGNFLRKTSLDELPQFYNILKGDMSLIGTRPPTMDEFEAYNSYYRRRLSMTPGLTGMWQISGRSDIEDFDEVVKLDLKYIDNWSLLLDFKIIFETFKVVLMRKGSK